MPPILPDKQHLLSAIKNLNLKVIVLCEISTYYEKVPPIVLNQENINNNLKTVF